MNRSGFPFQDNASMPGIDPRDAPTLSLLGHDLRAALSEVIGGLRLIEPAHLPVAAQLQIARTRAAGEALALLLEQALTLLLDEVSEGDERSAVIQTDRLVETIRLRWTERLKFQGLAFEMNACPDLPKHIGIDAVMLERVLSNLLGNAIKYAETGTVICKLAASAGRLLEITVSDQGPGFPKEIQKSLFTTYGVARTSAKPGSGLGLMIVHEMVVGAGGTIIARNRPEGGAEVIVRLPLPKIDVSAAKMVEPLLLDGFAAPRVLVADDNPTSRMLHSRLLTNMGAEVVTVADGVQAIGRIEREHFDLAMIDIEMPQMNGLDVIRHIREMAGPTADLPILAVTAYRLRANRIAIEAAGADGIVSKPVQSTATLRDQVVTAIARRTQLRDTGRERATEQVVPLQFARLIKMAGPEVAPEMLAGIQSDLRKIERDLLAASHGPVWPNIARQTHNLIAIAGTAGAEKLQHLATRMNMISIDPAPDRSTFLSLLPQLLESLDGLIQFVGDYATNAGVAK